MPFDGILRAIRTDTDTRLREIADATAAEVAVITSRAEAAAGEAETAATNALDLTTDRQVASIVDRARLDARRARLRSIESAYQTTLDAVRARLGGVRATAAYREIVAALLDEALRVVPDPERAVVDAADTGLVRVLLDERVLGCAVVASHTPRLGGLDLEAADGRVVRNTFDARLDRADVRLRALVAGHLPDGMQE